MIREAWKRSALGLGVGVVLAIQAAPSSAVELEPTPLPASPRGELEPNGDAQNASPISSGERIRANLLAANDVDYYAFTAQAGDRVFATVVTSASAGSSTDSELRLIDADGSTVIEFDDDNGSQLASASSIAGAAIPGGGTYFLAVENSGSEAATELPYDLYLQLRSGTPSAETEPNDVLGTANVLGDGFVSGVRDPASAGEIDFYSMQLQAGDTVFLSLDLDPERDGTSFDGRLGIGPSGDLDNQILLVNDPGDSEAPAATIPSEALTMTVSKAGTYAAYVDGASAAVGGPTATYVLSATILPAAQPGCRTYDATPVSSFLDGDSTSFGIPVEDAARIARAAVRLDLTDTLMSDLDVSLRDPNGNETPLFSDIGASSLGGQSHMEAVFDEFAAIPPAYTTLRPLMLQTEVASRLNWLTGRQSEGEWTLIVRDDDPNGSSGSAQAAELILCPQPIDTVAKEVFSAGFETGAERFTHSGAQDEWQSGLPSTAATATSTPVAGLSTCAQGSACFKTDLDGTYGSSSSQDLLSPPIPLTGLAGPIAVSWEQWHQLESARFDHAVVSVEEDGGANPRALFTWLGPTMSSALGGVNRPAAAGWSLHRADISEFAGKTIRLRFHLDSNAGGNYAGLAIDDVRVFEPGPPVPPAGGGSPVGVVPPPLGRTVVDGLSFKPATFRAAASGPSVSISKAASVGARLSYSQYETATATLLLYRALGGRLSQGECKASAQVERSAPKCTRFALIGSFEHADDAGRVRLRLSGRIRGHRLAPGKYRLELSAQAPGKEPSETLRAAFRIVP